MDRLRVWMDSRSSSMNDIEGECEKQKLSPRVAFNRPPPLRTSNTYDDDEAFSNVALNLLSRQEALDLSVEEAIKSTLVKPQDRASFFEGLQLRKTRASHVSPTTLSLIDNLEKTFGRELKRLVEAEGSGSLKGSSSSSSSGRCGMDNHPPTTPRHLQGPPMSSGSWPGSGSQTKKKRKNRRFFPDCDSVMSNSFFRSRRVKNIDWKLAEAVTQVESLQLDGTVSMTPTTTGGGDYEPPAPTKSLG